MKKLLRFGGAVAILGATVAATIVAAPASAAPVTVFGSSVDVVAQPSGASMLNTTGYFPELSGAIVVNITAPNANDITIGIVDGGATVDSCTIVAGNTGCSMSPLGMFALGANPVTVRFTSSGGGAPVDIPSTIFRVTAETPVFTMEWRDAAGNWVDGSGVGLPFLADLALRCLVRNPSNAPITLGPASAVIGLSGSSVVVPLTGTVAAGATRVIEVWSGPSAGVSSGQCSGTVSRPDGTLGGSGTGGGVIPISGSITIDRPLALGATVTVTGDGLTPPYSTSLRILFDGVEVTDSPQTLTDPDYDFTSVVTIPGTLAPGTHTLSIVAEASGRDIAYAAFTLDVPRPQLAATGVDLVGPVGLGTLGLGAALLVLGALALVRARRTTATDSAN